MRTKLRDTFDKTSYESLNARIIDVVYGPNQGLSLLLQSQDRDYKVNIVTNGVGDPLRDLMLLIGAEDFSEIEDQLVRSLHFSTDLEEQGDDLRTHGIANIIGDRTLMLRDYERHAQIMQPAAEPEAEIFTMSSIEPPPGIPWIITTSPHDNTQDLAALELDGAEGDVPNVIAENLNPQLVDWLVNTAKIATRP